MRRSSVAIGLLVVFATVFVCSAEDPIDMGKLRRLHQKAQKGEKLTPEEQAYYERGKAARRRSADSGKKKTEDAHAGTPKTSTGLVPLSDLKSDQQYHGEDGGLYGGGSNVPPPAHLEAALKSAAKIRALDSSGKPAANGKIVLLTHGMSNTTQESQQFLQLANADPRKNPAVLLIDGAQGGVDSRQWVSGKADRNGAKPWERLDERLKAAGATAQQVQVVWMKHAIARVGQFGEFPKHAIQLKEDLAEISRTLKSHYPNLQLIFLSSRTYAGYASTPLNPEPYAYESAFAVRWVILDQIKGTKSLSYNDGTAPVLLWGPYLWADGEKGRMSDDLIYKREDFRDVDGTHPSDSGRQKVAAKLLQFFHSDPAAKSWFNKEQQASAEKN